MYKMKIALAAIYVVLACASQGSDKTQYITELAAKIQNLNDVLYNMALSVPVGQGSQFLQNIRQFNQYLKEMVELSYEDKNFTKSALDSLVTSGAPKFFKIYLTHKERLKILDNFNWTLDDLNQLYADRVTANTYWTDLLLIKNNNYQYDDLIGKNFVILKAKNQEFVYD